MGVSFSLNDWQPTGITMIEASAGTGKTFTLASMCVRGFAQGWLDPTGLCAVTFSDRATAELKDRLRSQTAEVHQAFLDARSNPDQADSESVNPVFAALWQGVDDDERDRRTANLERALSDFDAVSVSTIHGFCQRVLSSLGEDRPAAATTFDINEVTTDLLLGRFSHPDQLPLSVESLQDAVRARIANPDLGIWPSHPEVDELIGAVATETQARRQRLGYRSFDDLIVATRDAVVASDRHPTLVSDLRRRFSLVLIDEFQDTDRVQWDLFRSAFADPGRGAPVPMVLVGDPKQSIYRFRGAELSSYLDAKAYTQASGGTLYELTTNYRSSPALIDSLDHLFSGFTFGEGVDFVSVAARPDGHPQLTPLPAAALQLRLLPGKKTGPIEDTFRDDLADVVIDLLTTGQLETTEATRPLKPSDIAILTRSNSDGEVIMNMLRSIGVPASASSEESVLSSRAAREWATLLRSLATPSSVALARTVAVGWFGRATLQELDEFTDADDLELLEQVAGWATTLTRSGLPHLLAALRRDGLRERLLGRVGGERDLTDVDHIAELMQQHTGGAPVQPEQLTAFLSELAQTTVDRTTSELLERRIDRDDETVKVMTIHKAKGLEFPVVLCAGLWRGAANTTDRVRHAYHPELDRRVIDSERLVGAKAGSTGLHPLIAAEELGEAQRLVYVALTRAKYFAAAWWAPDFNTRHPAFRSVLAHSCDEELDRWIGNPSIPIDAVPVNPPPLDRTRRWKPPVTPVDDLAVRTFSGQIDHVWGSWSFSRILRIGTVQETARWPQEYIPESDEPAAGGTDETSPDRQEPTEAPTTAFRPDESALVTAPGGVSFGLLVHSILEHTDFASPQLASELVDRARVHLQYHDLEIDPESLAGGLQTVVEAPLGGPLGSFRLADLQRDHRLDELWFHLPVSRLTAAEIAATICDHLPDDDPLLDWFRAVANGLLNVELEGLLNGSIDLVGRTGDRYWLADYKSNRIGNQATFSTPELAHEMAHHGYPLQAALYLLALHRILRLRLPDYDPTKHLCGAAYLFVRGMAGRTDGHGVFWWQPPEAMLDALDALVRGSEQP